MKKLFALVLVVICVTTMFCGCGSTNPSQSQTLEQSNQQMLYVPGEKDLVYDTKTHIVYYYYQYVPYYSENGYICRYNPNTDAIEEIIH